MSEIIAYKDQNNEYFDFEIENSKPVMEKSEDRSEEHTSELQSQD